MYGESNVETYITICKIVNRNLQLAQETQTGALYQPREVGWGGKREGDSKGRGYMYTYGWFMLRFDVQARFRRGRGTRDQIANILWIIEKARELLRKSISALLSMPKPLTVWITINCGKFWERWKWGSKGRGYMYTYGRFILRFDRKQQNSV